MPRMKLYILLVLLSAAVGALTYRAAASYPVTVAIEAKTLEKGVGQVYWSTDAGLDESSSQSFVIDDDGANLQRYEVELPPVKFSNILIPPLAGNGRFEMNSISVSGSEMRYIWDKDGVCSQQTLSPRSRKEPCRGAVPALNVSKDLSINIAAIPAGFLARPAAQRIFAAIVIATGVFLGGVWLLRPTGKTVRNQMLQCYSARMLWLALVALYLYRFYLVRKYSVDVPYQDEWEYFSPDALANGLSVKWVFGFHNEHRIVFTKLLAWLDLRMFGLDFSILKMVNFALFGSLLLAVAGLKKRLVSREEFTSFPAFLFFMLSPIAVENHLWGFQSQFHLFLIFAVVALYHCYDHDHGPRSSMLFTLFTLMAMYSFSGGVVFALVAMACRTIHYCWGSMADGSPGKRAQGLSPFLISSALILSGLVLWAKGYPNSANRLLLPNTVQFWEFFLNVVSFGFGFEEELSLWAGMIPLLIIFTPVALLLWRRETRWQAATWQVITAILVIVAMLAAITVGRGSFCHPKLFRYTEISFMLVPLTSLALWLAIRPRLLRVALLSLLWLYCLASYRNDWSMDYYRYYQRMGNASLECIERYLHNAGTDVCPEAYTLPLGKYLDEARRMDVKFTRSF